MRENWEKFLDQNGTEVVSSNRTPFNLEEPDYVWIVRAGAVDVFLVEAPGGQPAGLRQHLMRVEVGDALFGLSAQDHGYLLLAVGLPETRLTRLPLASLHQFTASPEGPDTTALLIEGWISRLSGTLTGKIYPRPAADFLLRGKSQTAVTRGKTLSTLKEVLWLNKIPSGSLFIGLEFLPDGRSFFPLSPESWVSFTQETTVEAFPTAEILSCPELWDGLRLFHRVFLACHITNISLEKVDEHLKMKETAAYREQAAGQALYSLSGVIDAQDKEPPSVSQQADSLATACALVADASKILFQIPDGFRSEKYADPLREILHTARIRSRKVSLQGEWWLDDGGPLLAYLSEEHRPVALLPVSPGRYNLIDPRNPVPVPVTRLTTAGVSATAYTFYRSLPDRPLRLRDLLALAFTFSRRDILLVVLTGLAASGLGFLIPVFTGLVLDTVIPENSHLLLYQILAALLISGAATGVFQLTRSISMLRIKTRADVSLQSAIWDRLLKLPTGFFRNYSAGEMAVRASGIENISMILSTTAITVLLSSVFSLFYIILLFCYSPTLALRVMLIIVITLLFMICLSRAMLRAYRQAQQSTQKIGSVVFQLLTGIQKLRTSGTESSALALWANRFREMRLALFRFNKLNNYGALFYSLLPLVSLVIAYYLFSTLPDSRSLSTGAFLAFVAAMSTIISSLAAIGSQLTVILPIIPIYENLKPVLTTPLENADRQTLSLDLKGRIEINRVSFRYRNDAPPVLKNMDIRIEPGEHVALVGPSGSGKSTLARLLLGFEKPESGTIYYDGQDLSSLDLTSVRQQIGSVLQNSKLNAGSVFNNITGGLSELTEGEVWEALSLVGLEEEVRQMPMGLYTLVSEGGSTFSGGQRQRLLLARALARRPRLVILDEATSFLDNQTQEIVSRSLDKMKITRVTIAHRISTIMNADTIYVIQNGEIVEKGRYADLMSRRGIFAELTTRQML